MDPMGAAFGIVGTVLSAVWTTFEKLGLLPTPLVEYAEDMELATVLAVLLVGLLLSAAFTYSFYLSITSRPTAPPKIEETPTPSPTAPIVTALSPGKLVFRLPWPPEPDHDLPAPTRTFVRPGGAARFARYMTGGVVSLKANDEWETVKSIINETDFPVLVALVAKWSNDSQKMIPKLLEMSQEYVQSIIVVKADVNDVSAAADECGTSRGLPVFQLWHRGKCVGETVGVNEDDLEELVDEYVSMMD
eukprot:TRINITY_DN7724_c0_g1_i1.p1 TRINITY_DN7724_c0_g1~~TRINITY_DN7724_c0_g1_i1.p1  ORF type:complete len:247 (+),score=73.30 TRINITY_DN7724_c0_g1_i1:1-741(+)